MRLLAAYLAVGLVVALVMTERKYPNEPPLGLKLLAVAALTLAWLPAWVLAAMAAAGRSR